MEGHRAIWRQGPAVQHPTVQVFTRKHIAKNGVGRIVGDIGVSLRFPLAIIGALAVVVIDHIVGIGYIGAVELPLLGHVQASHLFGRIAEILLRLIPAVKGIAVTVFMLMHLIGCQVTGCHIVGVNLGTDSAVSVDQVIIHRELIPDHADDVGPAVDGDGIAQLVVGISVYILVPAAVVVPAFELIASGELVGLVELVDLQRGQVKGLALVHIIGEPNGLIGIAGVAVPIDHQHNGIGFALGLEGHFVAGTLGNLPAVVVDKLHRGGGIADVFVLHVELFRKVCHIGISLDGDGAGIAVHGCDVAAYQKFSKCPVMCGMRGLALDIDVDEGIQLLHGGSLRGGNLVGHRVEFDCITAIGNDLRDSHRSIFIRSSVRTIGIPAGDFLISRYRRQIGEGDLSLVIDVIFPVEPAHSTGAGDVAGVSGAAYIFIGNVDIIVLIIRSCERFSIFIIICY